ncbi:hypothetical protein FPD46_04930 [Campylobacter peloridis]|uniref:Uncharacterized protein n=1 Tax=Campylobacter peloridis TaxID=488546 RepID=A0A5C7DPP8_9BACT|nr:hypothetical protein [Campylobacter peloridis]TXE81635.1 hypothetical protein FPD46_04930 [Campylobacter peloridis]
MIVFPLSSFNEYFGRNPLETLNKIKNEITENKNPELTKKQKEKLGNDLIYLYKISKKFSDKIELIEGSIEDKLRKNELSKSEVKDLFKWIGENAKSPRWLSINGVNYDEAYVKIFHTSKSIDELKEKYLELQNTYFVDFSKKINESQETSEKDIEKTFKPIQAESKNKETYKDDNTKSELVNKLLEDKFSTSKELELLFGMKFNYENIEEFNQFLSQDTTPKIIDIKT